MVSRALSRADVSRHYLRNVAYRLMRRRLIAHPFSDALPVSFAHQTGQLHSSTDSV